MDICAIKIQKVFRGYLYRLKKLPLILYIIQKYLQSYQYNCSNENEDGRMNSCIDENKIINILQDKYSTRIQIPKIRYWYDILILDFYYGWIPVNIKTTTTLSPDNVGNLALCVHSYTDHKLNLENTYNNGIMSKILIDKLHNKSFNRTLKKDYYFIVLNKLTPNDIIINSMRGLSNLTPNSHNLPFQICWNKNRYYEYGKIEDKVRIFVKCLNKYVKLKNWRTDFMKGVRKIKFKRIKNIHRLSKNKR
jgi:hypothetical protein